MRAVIAWLGLTLSDIGWSETLSNAEKLLKIAASGIGGLWTHLKFIGVGYIWFLQLINWSFLP
jgi:hypothetical protein